MRWLLIGIVAAMGCGGPTTPAGPTWTEFQAGEVRGYETLFYRQEAFELSEGQQTLVSALCPRVRRGHASRANDQFWMVTLQVEGLEALAKVGARLGDVNVADVGFQVREGEVDLPVACESCLIYLGVRLPDGRTAACLGAGWSVQFDQGVVSSP